ncbi:hypothetical protein FGO68_gene14979 [Halteria grandinella]|uniref:Uncharacterized protein n=1 Tax=Halteria grandinella TaxID=5974 RepID=A0A8J8NYY9_HALGN|nr:hypothetical protein FGO68_gene14979 [Halteria grandinella]
MARRYIRSNYCWRSMAKIATLVHTCCCRQIFFPIAIFLLQVLRFLAIIIIQLCLDIQWKLQVIKPYKLSDTPQCRLLLLESPLNAQVSIFIRRVT